MALFRLLPEDIQLTIFHSWFEDENSREVLKALSALDVACCNKPVRQAFLALCRRLQLNGHIHSTKSFQTKYQSSYMLWLTDRGISVKFLHIRPTAIVSRPRLDLLTHLRKLAGYSERNSIPLVSVTHLLLDGELSRESCLLALGWCGHVTQLDIHHDRNKQDDFLWSILAMQCKLTHINLQFARFDVLRSTTNMMAALRHMGVTLIHLSLKGVACSEAFLHCLGHCKLLQNLEIAPSVGIGASHSQSIVNLINSCVSLRALSLTWFGGTIRDIDAILSAGSLQQLKSFAVSNWNQDATQLMADFANTLHRNPWLDCLKFNTRSLFERVHGAGLSATVTHLVTCTGGLTEACAQLILDACHELTKLELIVNQQSDSLALATIAGLFHCMLLEITLYAYPVCCSQATLARLPARCPALKRLIYEGFLIDDAILEDVAHACRQLEHVRISVASGVLLVGDTGFRTLVTNCCKLKIIDIGNAPGCTKRSLEAILTCGVRLTSMTWGSKVGFDQADVDEFLAQAKQQQLLPLPKVLWTTEAAYSFPYFDS